MKNELDKIAEKMSNLTLRQGGLVIDSAAGPALSQDPVNHENMDTGSGEIIYWRVIQSCEGGS